MPSVIRPAWLTTTLGLLFFISGFTGLLYQLVWLRLAFASFGIVTSVLSVVVAVFMLGLSLGSWLGGKAISPLSRRTGRPAIEFYGLSEFLIGLGAFVVPKLFEYGEHALLGLGGANSIFYLSASAVVLGISLLPWCIFMGTTFPFMMAYMKQIDQTDGESFSFLYACNVLGALVGTVITAFIFIEILGFRHTLWVAGIANFLIGALSLAIGSLVPGSIPSRDAQLSSPANTSAGMNSQSRIILFTTGFASLAMEVVWTRAYTPILGTQVYAFALLLFVYLLATRIGSVLYRKHLENRSQFSNPQLLALLSVTAFLPLVVNDPQIVRHIWQPPNQVLIILMMASLFPFCAVLGYLTPAMIDRVAKGNPALAGKAYAVNILGCILGPLVTAYILLPQLGAKYSMIVLALPFAILFTVHIGALTPQWRWVIASLTALFFVSSLVYHLTYEDPRGRNSDSYVVRRDHTATVTSTGRGMEKRLYINGIGITYLTPITKFMAHLPLAFLPEKAESALVICLGMGTTYRSLLSWDIQVVGVELVPSVKDALSYYFDDAHEVLANPNGQVVIDDGRRYLKRTQKKFDIVTIDAPPPVEAAGSSLLYTEEFYESVKQHLTPNGVLQQWFPGGEFKILQAVARSLANQFPYVRVYQSVEGWGFHFLASMRPLGAPAPEQIAQRMPVRAQTDLLEWAGEKNLAQYLSQVLNGELPIGKLLRDNSDVRITDDHPFNEYYLLRRLSGE